MIKKTRLERVQDHIQLVADTLIQQIEAGMAPWQRTWKPGERPLAHNLLTRNDYNGYNQMWLLMVAASERLTDTRWGTYRQIKEAGGQVRRGEKGTTIMAVFEVNEREREEAIERGEDPPSRRLAPKAYHVFNALQADGLPPLEPEKPSWDPCERADEILQKSGVPIVHGGDQALYNISRDEIRMPHKSRFDTPEKYYVAAFHELAHATGHASRLNRGLMLESENADEYAREELRAQISALLTCTQLGLGFDPQNDVSYVSDWSSLLKDRPEEIRVAAAEAQTMSSYLLRGMGKESKVPDLSWTAAVPPEPEKKPSSTPARESSSRSQSAIPDVMASMGAYTGLSFREQAIRNGYGAEGKKYRAQPAWACSIEAPEGMHDTGIEVSPQDLVGPTAKLHGKSPEEVAKMHIKEVMHRNQGIDLSNLEVRVEPLEKSSADVEYQYRVGDLNPQTRQMAAPGMNVSVRPPLNQGSAELER